MMKYEEKNISDIAEILNGYAFKSKKYVASGIRIIRIANVQDGRIVDDLPCFYPEKSDEDIDKYRLCQGDILLSLTGNVGRVGILPQEMLPAALNQRVCCLRIKEDIISKLYLFYWLRREAFVRDCIKASKGVAQLNLSSKWLADYTVPVPPIQEQNRIVSKIEELFSQLDSGVETLKKTKQQLTVYRQAVLKEAFDDITVSMPMHKVATMIDPQPSHRTPPEYNNGVPYIGVGDIDYINGRINFSSARKESPSVLEEHFEKYCLREGDFIMGKIGTIGKPYRIVLPQDYTLSANVILIQPKSDNIDPKFLFWQFSSPWITQQLTKGSSATSQPAFGIKKARLLSIRIPNLTTQHHIVEAIESRMSVCDSIERTIDAALQQAEALRQSILKKAFEGGL